LTISAPADVIFAILADPRQHVLIDGSGTVKGTLSAPARLSPGAKFGMRMQLQACAPYWIRNTVVEFEEQRRIAWRHFMRHTWSYRLEPQETEADGRPRTLVTETFDPRSAVAPWLLRMLGFQRRNARAIEQTLERLRGAAESRVGAGAGFAGSSPTSDSAASGADPASSGPASDPEASAPAPGR
jgi:hypothetical protein